MTDAMEVRARGAGIGVDTPLAKWLHLLFLAAPALLYYLTACRTPGWADATLIASDVTNLTLSSWVDTHSLFNLLGYLWLKLFSRQDIHFHLVLLSGLFGAVSVYFVFRAVLELTSEVISAGTAALVLTVSHSLWWHSTMLEVYTLNSAIIAIMLYLVIRYDRTGNPIFFYLAAFFGGLGCTNHVLMGLYLVAFLAVVVYRIVRPVPHGGRHIGIAILCFLIGISFYLVLFLRRVAREMLASAWSGGSWPARAWQAFRSAFDAATGGKFRELMFAPGMPAQTRRFWRLNYFFWLVANFPSPALAMGFYGLWAYWKKRTYRLSFCFFLFGILTQAVWSANYFVWDMYAFAQPVYVMFAIPVGLAAEDLLRSRRALRIAYLVALAPMLLLPGLLYARLPVWYHNGGFFQRFFDSYPQISWTTHTWEPVEYVTNPNKRTYDKVQRYADAVFAILPQGSHLLNSDSRSDYPLRYYYRDIYHIRTDIVHHSLYSPFVTPKEGRGVAQELKRLLDAGAPVYSASIMYPEKVVLDQLYLLNDPSRDLDSIQRLSQDEYVRSFPGVTLQKIVLSEPGQVWIYRLVPRSP